MFCTSSRSRHVRALGSARLEGSRRCLSAIRTAAARSDDFALADLASS